MYTMPWLAVPEETSSCFQIYISNLSDLSEQLDKQILFYWNDGECTSKKKNSASVLLLLYLDKLWEHVSNKEYE